MTGRSGRFIEQIRQARREGRLPPNFTASDVKEACPGWAENTYPTFMPKHRKGNPGGTTELFVRDSDGTYALIEESSLGR